MAQRPFHAVRGSCASARSDLLRSKVSARFPSALADGDVRASTPVFQQIYPGAAGANRAPATRTRVSCMSTAGHRWRSAPRESGQFARSRDTAADFRPERSARLSAASTGPVGVVVVWPRGFGAKIHGGRERDRTRRQRAGRLSAELSAVRRPHRCGLARARANCGDAKCDKLSQASLLRIIPIRMSWVPS